MVARKYEQVWIALDAARVALAENPDMAWPAKLRDDWKMALDDIEAFLDGDVGKRGFSIVRSLDAFGGSMDSEIGTAILKVSRAARDAGIDRYR